MAVRLMYDFNQKLTTKEGRVGYYCWRSVKPDGVELVLSPVPTLEGSPISDDSFYVRPEDVLLDTDIAAIEVGKQRAKHSGYTSERWDLIEQSKCCFKAAFVHCGCTCLALMNCPEHGWRHTFPFGNQGAPHPG
jgi:hypothetical protein